MYPDLSYLFHDLFGTDLDNWTSIFKTFGLMLALAFIACAVYVRAELKRKEEEGLLAPMKRTITTKAGIDWQEIITNSAILGLFAFKVPMLFSDFASFQQDPAGALFSMKGSPLIGLLVFGAAAAYNYYIQNKEDRKASSKEVLVHPYQITGDIIITAAVSGIIGAKVFSIIENLDAFFADPLGQLLSGSGLTVYGGLIFGIIAVYLKVKKAGIRPVHMFDIGGPGILLGYAVGRMGCQFSGDGDWGIVAKAQPDWWFLPDWMWSYTFPNNVANSGKLIDGCDAASFASTAGPVEIKCLAACGQRYCHELAQGVYPTSFYEILMTFAGLGVFWLFRKRIKIGGMVFALYMMFNGVERFFIETIRVNDRYDYFGLGWSQAQWISVGFFTTGLILAIYLYKYGTRHRDMLVST